MRNWTIGKRLVLGFGAVVSIVTILGAYSASQLRVIKVASDRVVLDSLPGTALSGRILAHVKNNLSLTLEHLTSDAAADMATIEAEVARTRELITEELAAYEKTITRPDDRALFDKVKPAREKFVAAFGQTISASKAGRKDEAFQHFRAEVKPAYQALEAAVTAVSDWNVEAGEAAGKTVADAVSSTMTGVLTGVGVAMLMAVGVGLIIIRSTGAVLRSAVNSLREGAEQVASASGQVATASQSLSQGATEQAASLEETSASMEEMASMTRQNAENSRQAAALMLSVDAKVRESNQSLDEMVASMTAINESSDKISRIIKTIDEIAFQTNILALNAAVEAARAGEAGMGFAVVADEVRSLAQRSAQAAKDTAGLIEESIARSSEGATRVQQVASSIRGITDAVTEVKGLVDAVSTASVQQSQGIDQVSQAVAQMEKVTQTNAATAEESAAASEELNAQAGQSMDVVEQLDALVGGAAAVAPVAQAPVVATAVAPAANVVP
ncbi:MAG: methyl-accepting chemotaxis protein, partial [Vicinamibacterales bacterium]